MKNNIKKILIVALVSLLLISSCRPYEDLARDYTEVETWGEFFDLYWKRMSTNYAFWELDYNEGRDWDNVYDKYMPLFDALGDIQNNLDGRELAYSYLYDIIEPLSDMHYDLLLNTIGVYNLGNSDSIHFSTLYIKLLKNLGFSKEDIIEFLKNASVTEKFYAYRYRYYDRTNYTYNYIVNNNPRYNFNAYPYPVMDSNGEVICSLAINDENILYLGFSEFNFSSQLDNNTALYDFVFNYFRKIGNENIKGIIIDLRGNEGGQKNDLDLLWTPFFPEDVTSVKIAELKTKSREGRTSYGPYCDFSVYRIEDNYRKFGSVDRSVPIAILQNNLTISCAELSILFFKALRDNYGYKVRTFGETSAGGNGALYELGDDSPVSEDRFNGGITYDLKPYATKIYTPYCLTRAYDGNIYEGRGIPADEEIAMNYEEFINGNDLRLNAALSWIRSQNREI